MDIAMGSSHNFDKIAITGNDFQFQIGILFRRYKHSFNRVIDEKKN